MALKCVDDQMVKITDEMKNAVHQDKEIDEETKTQLSRCIMMKMGFMNEAGQIMMEKMRETLESKMRDKSKFDEMMQKCNKMMDTPLMTAKDMMKCMRDFHDKQCGC